MPAAQAGAIAGAMRALVILRLRDRVRHGWSGSI